MTDERPRSRLLRTLRTLRHEVPSDHLFTVAAGLAYYGVFGLLPTLAGAAALWNLVGDPSQLQQSAQSGANQGLLPQQATNIVQQFLSSVPDALNGGWGLTLNLSMVVYIAWRSARSLLTALNIAYDVDEARGTLWRALIALGIGLGGIAYLFLSLAVLALPPLLMRAPALEASAVWLRWPVLAAGFCLGLAALFRWGPHRRAPNWWSILAGAVSATLLWTAASVGVALYVRFAGGFGRMYGSLGGIAIVLLWFWLGACSVLLGAEIDGILSAPAAGRDRSELKAALRRRSKPED